MKSIFLILFSAFICVFPVLSQDLKKKKVTSGDYIEEYFVLKENKKIKHGQYLKFKKDMLDRKILVEIGNFDKNIKSGTWYSFFSHGSIKSYGAYVMDKKEGPWIEYYRYKGEYVLSPFAGIRHSAQINEEGALEINTEGLNISAEGAYQSNSKVGIWDYYSKEGHMLHKYDHSNDSLIENTMAGHSDLYCPYLGGFDRFIMLYVGIRDDIHFGIVAPSVTSEAIFKLDLKKHPYKLELDYRSGDPIFAEKIFDILREMPPDWARGLLNSPGDVLFIKTEFIKEKNQFTWKFDPV